MMKDRNSKVKEDNHSVEPTVIKTAKAKNGQEKCPKCGSTDISLNVKTGKLRCNYCRYEFAPLKAKGFTKNIHEIEGQIIGAGAQNIVADTKDIVTLKCSSCGAEVVIDTSEVLQARCHWCRNTLSIQEQIPNGSVPDIVLPFHLSKEQAKQEIEKFVRKRKFFANSRFRKEFTTENIMGVYFPYMVVDANTHVKLSGKGEHLVRTYSRGSSNNRRIYYDADLYQVEREFDLMIDDLAIESNKDRLDYQTSKKTNNVINAIMPFDLENAVTWDANYLKGYTSERRDTNIADLQEMIETQSKDIARFAANETLEQYDRGVCWEKEELLVKGQEWKAAYLPVWLYSYQQEKKNQKILHYVAVNARTKETMGSVPIHTLKLFLISFLIELLGIYLMFHVDFDFSFLFATIGFLYYFLIWKKYRNKSARYKHEVETKKTMENVRKVDRFIERKTGLSNARMIGENNQDVNGKSTGNQFFDF